MSRWLRWLHEVAKLRPGIEVELVGFLSIADVGTVGLALLALKEMVGWLPAASGVAHYVPAPAGGVMWLFAAMAVVGAAGATACYLEIRRLVKSRGAPAHYK